MLNSFLANWNSLYNNHVATIVNTIAQVHENDVSAHFTDLFININRAVSLPSRDLDAFSLFGAINNKNCDGAFLIEIQYGVFDLVFIELKSGYDTEKLFDAKEQVLYSLPKLNILLSSVKDYSRLSIRKTYGIIVSLSPDDNDLNWIQGKFNLPRNQWGKHTCGLKLYQDRHIEVDTPNLCIDSKYLPKKFDLYYFESQADNLTIDLPV